MRVRTSQSVEIDVECDVSLDDCINEFWQRLEERGDECRRSGSDVIDSATRLLAKVPDRVIAALNPSARSEVIQRLQTQLARYQ